MMQHEDRVEGRVVGVPHVTDRSMTVLSITTCIDMDVGMSPLQTFGKLVERSVPSESVVDSVLTCSLVLKIPGPEETDLRYCI